MAPLQRPQRQPGAPWHVLLVTPALAAGRAARGSTEGEVVGIVDSVP